MTLKRKLYIVGLIFLVIAILSQAYLESPWFGKDSQNGGWDELGLAVQVTMYITLPSFIIALIALIPAIVMSVERKHSSKSK